MHSESLRFRLKNPNAQVREQAALELVFAPDKDYLTDLSALLQDADSDVRRTAIQALAAINAPEALPELRSVLLDTEPEIVSAAEHALSKFGFRAEGLLREWLASGEWLERAAALQALALFKDAAHLPWASPLLQDPIWEVRAAAIYLIGQSASAEGFALLASAWAHEGEPQVRSCILAALGEVQQPEACALLLQLFLEPDLNPPPEQAEQVARSLALYGEAVWQRLVHEGLWAAEPQLRCLSAALLAQSGYPELKEALSPLLMDAQPEVRQTVAFAFYQAFPQEWFWEYVAGLYHDDHQVFEAALAGLLSYPDARIGQTLLDALDLMLLSDRCEALIRALADLDYSAAAPALIELLDILPEQTQHIAICEALGKFQAWRAYHPLQKRLGHPDPIMQQAALSALTQIASDEKAWQQLQQLESLPEATQRETLRFVSQQTHARAYLFYLARDHTDPRLQRDILHALRSARAPETRHLLQWWLPQPEVIQDLELVRAILQALGENELLPRQPALLLGWLRHKEAEVRLQAAILLQPFAKSLQSELLALAQDELWFIRQAALKALSCVQTPELLHQLEQALEDRDRDVRIMAVQLLGRFEGHRSSELLIAALENGYRDIRAAAALALGQQGDEWALENLELALAEDEAAEVRIAAAEALASLQHPELAELLEDALSYEEDPQALAQLLTIFHRCDPNSALPWLLRMLRQEQEAPVNTVCQLLNTYPTARWISAVPTLSQWVYQGSERLQQCALGLILQAEPEQSAAYLQDSLPHLMISCLQQLSVQQAQKHTLQLLRLQQHPNPAVRQALYRVWLRDAGFWPLLLQYAPQESESSCQQVLIECLAQLPAEQSGPLLLQWLEQQPPEIQRSAAWALLSQPDFEPWLIKGLGFNLPDGLRQEILKQISQQGHAAIHLLKQLAEHWDRHLMHAALRALGQCGPEALPLLMQHWQTGELAVQRAVLEGLKALNHPDSLPLLEQAACATHDNLRSQAFDILRALGTQASQTLQQLALHPQAQIRYDACLSLASIHSDSNWLHLQGLNSQLQTRRLSHLLALQQTPAEDWFAYSQHLQSDRACLVRQIYAETLPPETARQDWQNWLQQRFREDVLPVQLQALQTLSKLSQTHILPPFDGLSARLREMSLCLLAARADFTPLPAALQDASSWVQLSAVALSGYFRRSECLPRLVSLLNTAQAPELRASAIWAIGQMQDSSQMALLKQHLSDSDYGVRRQSVIALGQLPDAAAAECLLQQLQGGESDVELLEEILRALGRQAYAPAAAELIELSRQHQDITLRLRALEALASLQEPSVHSHLQEVVYWNEQALAEAARSMLQQRGQAQAAN